MKLSGKTIAVVVINWQLQHRTLTLMLTVHSKEPGFFTTNVYIDTASPTAQTFIPKTCFLLSSSMIWNSSTFVTVMSKIMIRYKSWLKCKHLIKKSVIWHVFDWKYLRFDLTCLNKSKWLIFHFMSSYDHRHSVYLSCTCKAGLTIGLQYLRCLSAIMNPARVQYLAMNSCEYVLRLISRADREGLLCDWWLVLWIWAHGIVTDNRQWSSQLSARLICLASPSACGLGMSLAKTLCSSTYGILWETMQLSQTE